MLFITGKAMSFPSISAQFTREYYDEVTKQIPSAHINQRSAYEEIEIVEGCTLYDIYRQPRKPVIDPDATKVLHVRDLNSNLTCPICLGLINQTMVVMECLHRFCGECIQKCLRLAIKECPSCRIHIPSKRALRRDLNFDALIATIYPNRQEFEQQEAQLIEDLNRSRNYKNILTNSVKRGLENEVSTRKQRGRKSFKGTSRRSSSSSYSQEHLDTTSNSKSEESARESKSTESTPLDGDRNSSSSTKKRRSHETDAEEVNLKVVLHPRETHLSKRVKKTLFRTSPRLKIRHLKRYLLGMMDIPKDSRAASQIKVTLPKENAEISGLQKGLQVDGSKEQKPLQRDFGYARDDLFTDQILADHVMLCEIYEQYGMGMEWEMKLWYHFSSNVADGNQDMLQVPDVTPPLPNQVSKDGVDIGDKQAL
uniref:Uncharacterized protein AlNc14C27G2643 n=1 Tax=Albugo laibachii Nc14 TaxID=890382 RepID=F0W711_9STRA|nr:conserved hypothetical protein [Albugo laibachii Nc14]|eukprot:CCA16906.1 conserved hypothetical protein [Albugo laibachii Nc14]